MKKIIKGVVALFTFIVASIVPIVTYADADTMDNGTWAFYVYTVDNNENTSYNKHSLKEIKDVNLTDKVEVIVESSANNSLADFFKSCKKNDQADHKVFILIGDGKGVYGLKDSHGGYVTLSDIRDSLSINYEVNEDKPVFDLVFFDASLMGCAEVGKIFDGFAKYLVAPETLMYAGNGFYNNWFSNFVKNTNVSAYDLGMSIIDTYKELSEKIMGKYNKIYATNLSLYDVSKLSESYKAYTSLVKNIIKRMNNDNLMLALVARKSLDTITAARTGNDDFDFNMLDFMDFMNKLSKYYPMETAKVKNELEKAILYKVNNGFTTNLCGASLYFPRKTFSGHSKFMNEYLYAMNDPYVSALYTYKMDGTINEDFESIIKKEKYNKIKPIDYSVCDEFELLNPATGGKVGFTYKMPINLKGLSQYAYINLSKREDNSFTAYDMDNYCDITSSNDIKVGFNGNWSTLESTPLAINLLDTTIDYQTFYTNVIFNGEKKKILFAYDENTKVHKIVGVIDESEQSEFLGDIIDLINQGDEIVLYESIFDITTGAIRELKTDVFTYNDNYRAESKLLPDGDYTFQVIYEDIRGVKHQGQNILFSIVDGKVGEVLSEKDLYERYE